MSCDHPTGHSALLREVGSSQSVLVVDDEEGIRQAVSLVLESAGYAVVCAVDGQEAFSILERRRFDLVITDMLMPGRDGLELLSVVKKIGQRTKVLVMSGGGIIGVGAYLNVAKKLGAHAVLGKPFTSEVLLETAAGLLKKEA